MVFQSFLVVGLPLREGFVFLTYCLKEEEPV
jgi:hypothetical protein